MPESKEFEEIGIQNTSSSDEEIYISLPSGTCVPDSDIAAWRTTNQSSDLSQINSNISSTQKVRNYLSTYKSRDQSEQALNVLNKIDELLMGYEDLDLPEFGIIESEDGSLGISWRFPGALFSIVIQPDIQESSWFLISGDVEKGLKADGNLNDLDFESQLSPLFDILRKIQIRRRR